MKTLIIVSIPGSVLGLDESDFPTGLPVEKRKYEFDGKIYQVTEIVETLGSRSQIGKKIAGLNRLLAFAETVSNGDGVLKQGIITPKQIGQHAPDDVVSKGGIILGQTEAPKLESGSDEPLHIMFVKAVPADTTGGGRLSPIRLQALTGPTGDESESALPAELAGGIPLHRALPGPDGEPYGTDELPQDTDGK